MSVTPGDRTVQAKDPVRESQLVSDIARPIGFFERHERALLPIAATALIFVIWELWGRIAEFNPLFFSYPTEIAQGFLNLVGDDLGADLRASGIEFGVGLAIALVGIPVGMVIGSSRRLRIALDPIIQGAYSTPTLTLTPLFVIWFGLGVVSKIALVALMAFFPLVINTIEGVSTVDPTLMRAARSFGASRIQTYRDVVFHSIVPFVVGGLRLALGRAIVAVVIGEFIAATEGVGYRIRAMAAVFKTPEYLAGIGILVATSVLLNWALKRAEARLAPWRATQQS